MPRRPTSKLTWAVLLLIVGVVVWFAWSMLFLHVEEPSGPVSASRASSFASVAIPSQAVNIRIAGYHHWVQYEQYVRFEAPTPVCLQTAAEMLAGERLQPIDSNQLESNAMPLQRGVFRDFSWFDLAKARSVVTGGGGPSKPQVWVDQDRGVFYFRKTD